MPSPQAASAYPDGDHAMLSGKLLGGYRCMACDRPLQRLDERPGPYVPGYAMLPPPPATAATATPGVLQLAGGYRRFAAVTAAAGAVLQQRARSPAGGVRRGRWRRSRQHCRPGKQQMADNMSCYVVT